MSIRTLRKVAPDWAWARVREFGCTDYYGRNTLDDRVVRVWKLARGWVVHRYYKQHHPACALEQWVTEENLAKRAKE